MDVFLDNLPDDNLDDVEVDTDIKDLDDFDDDIDDFFPEVPDPRDDTTITPEPAESDQPISDEDPPSPSPIPTDDTPKETTDSDA